MTFMKGAPGCCCCKDIWNFGVGQYRIKSETQVDTIVAFGGEGDYDQVNRVSFSGSLNGTSPLVIYKRIEQTETAYSLWFTGPTSSRSQGMMTCHPAAQQLYRSEHISGSTDNFIKRIDYDATNDTLIATVPGNSTTAAAVLMMVYHRENDILYYVKRAIDGVQRIYIGWLDPAIGTENLFYNIPSNSSQNGITEIELDYINDKVWWLETVVSGGTTRTVKRCDLDGTNQETVYTNTAPFLFTSGIQVSYKDQCLYTYDYDNTKASGSDPDGGLFKREFDYTEIERVMDRETTGQTFFRFRLGCGFETLGSGNLG